MAAQFMHHTATFHRSSNAPTFWQARDIKVFLRVSVKPDKSPLKTHQSPTTNGPAGTRDRARQAISPSYIPGDRIRRFPQSSLKLLPTRSSREHLNIQFHSFLNLDRGGYLLLSQAFFVLGGWGGVRVVVVGGLLCFICSGAGRWSTRQEKV